MSTLRLTSPRCTVNGSPGNISRSSASTRNRLYSAWSNSTRCAGWQPAIWRASSLPTEPPPPVISTRRPAKPPLSWVVRMASTRRPSSRSCAVRFSSITGGFDDDDVHAPVRGAAGGSGVGGAGMELAVAGRREAARIDALVDESRHHRAGPRRGQLPVRGIAGGADRRVVGVAFDAHADVERLERDGHAIDHRLRGGGDVGAGHRKRRAFGQREYEAAVVGADLELAGGDRAGQFLLDLCADAGHRIGRV